MEQAETYRERYALFDQVLEALVWELARNPQVGFQLPDEPEYWIYRTNAKGRTPSFRIIYSFHDEQVQLLAINAD